MGINASRHVWDNSKTKGAKLLLMLALAEQVRNQSVDDCWPSVLTLSIKTRITVRHVRRLIKELKNDNELDFIVRGGEVRANGRIIKTNKYKLHPGGLPITKSSPDIVKADPGHFKHNPGHLDGVSPDIAVSSEPLENQNSEPLVNRKRNSVGLTGQKIDYEKVTVPTITDYGDIYACEDFVLAAMAVTGEHDKKAWGYWTKLRKKARKNLGVHEADELFWNCLTTFYGEMKAGEVLKPGALLNDKLKKALAPVQSGDTSQSTDCENKSL